MTLLLTFHLDRGRSRRTDRGRLKNAPIYKVHSPAAGESRERPWELVNHTIQRFRSTWPYIDPSG